MPKATVTYLRGDCRVPQDVIDEIEVKVVDHRRNTKGSITAYGDTVEDMVNKVRNAMRDHAMPLNTKQINIVIER